MKSTNVHSELLSAFLDGELTDPKEIALVEQMLISDPSMKREADLIQSLRSQLRTRRSQLRTQVPVALERSIRLRLGEEVERSVAAAQKPSFLQRLMANLSRPVYAIPGALLVAVITTSVVMMVNRSGYPTTSTTATTASMFELTSASYANFEAVVRGDLKLTLASSDTSELKRFFKESGVTFDVFFPQMAAGLKGGVVSHHGNKHYAHLVYGVGSHTVYLLEVDEPSIADGSVSMASNVQQDVRESRWHWEERDDIGTLFVWKSNTVMCSAVSDLRTQDFSALFRLETL